MVADHIASYLLQDDAAQPPASWWWHPGAIRLKEFDAAALAAIYREHQPRN